MIDSHQAMFSYVSAEDRVQADHPLRPIRDLVDEIPRDMSRDFDGFRRPSRAAVDSVRAIVARATAPTVLLDRNERLLMAQLDDNILFRWFVQLIPEGT
jgi:hypothetical protein